MKKKALHMIGKGLVCLISLVYILPVLFVALQSLIPPEEIGELYANAESEVYGLLLPRLLPRAISLRQYYEILLAHSEYMLSFWSSALLSLECTAVCTGLALLLGYVLTVSRFPLRQAVIRLIAVLMLLPWQAVMLPEYILTRWMGLYDKRAALIVVQGMSSFSVFLMIQFMKGIPGELIDAASLDTNSNIRVLMRVVCPMVVPGILACAVIAFSESWNMLEQPMTLLENEALYPMSVILYNINTEHIGIAFAGCAVYMVPIFVIWALFGDRVTQGLETAGRLGIGNE